MTIGGVEVNVLCFFIKRDISNFNSLYGTLQYDVFLILLKDFAKRTFTVPR